MNLDNSKEIARKQPEKEGSQTCHWSRYTLFPRRPRRMVSRRLVDFTSLKPSPHDKLISE
jgi:hypothetical protein